MTRSMENARQGVPRCLGRLVGLHSAERLFPHRFLLLKSCNEDTELNSVVVLLNKAWGKNACQLVSRFPFVAAHVRAGIML